MPETDFKLEENLQPLLAEKKFEEIFLKVTNPENDSYVSENVWNLIHSICNKLKSDSLLENATDIEHCEKILMYLIDKGEPKEMLVSLLEQSDSFKDHYFFCLLLEPLKHTLKKHPGKRGKSLEWVLSTLYAHVETLEIPEDLDLEGEELLLLDVDPTVQDTVYVLSNYYTFIEFFVNEVSFENVSKTEVQYIGRIQTQREIMQRYILKLIHFPLVYQDLHQESVHQPKSTLRVICEKFVNLLSKMCTNVFNLFKFEGYPEIELKESEDSFSDDDCFVHSLAFANLSYLMFVENLTLEFQPFVYNNLYLFMKSLDYIILLLDNKNNMVLLKGLLLAESLLDQLNTSELNYDCIELEVFTKFPILIIDIAVLCKIEAYRKLSLKVFNSYVSKCNTVGRYHLIMQVLCTTNHSGAQALVINFYKNFLHEALIDGNHEHYFLGWNIYPFLRKIFVLNVGVDSDLLENSDRIITTLNFLRYLLIRDKEDDNVTGIWDMVDYVNEKFCLPLTTALDISRALFKETLYEAQEEGKMSKRNKDNVNTTVSVNNKMLSSLPLDMRKDVYQRALVMFDVIESLLSRVKELL